MGKVRPNPFNKGQLIKDPDTRFAFVTLAPGTKFEFPDLKIDKQVWLHFHRGWGRGGGVDTLGENVKNGYPLASFSNKNYTCGFFFTNHH